MKQFKLLWCIIPLFIFASCTSDIIEEPFEGDGDDESSESSGEILRPAPQNQRYWEHNGELVMLIGGSDDDDLFQTPNLTERLNLMEDVGANYVRNVMSDRDKGDLSAFKKLSNGKYDLSKWNEEYWNRFERFLKETNKRDIFVQIEIWDQHDHIESLWSSDPWNPQDNVNYSSSNTNLRGGNSYSEVDHNNSNKHDLFLTVPELHNDKKVLAFQKKFVDKILSYTFKYDHVLYTVTNELFDQHSIEWSYYWIDYVENKAEDADKEIQITEMFQDPDIKDEQHRPAYNNPETFEFVETSQNSSQRGQRHWDKLMWAREYIADNPRPINNTKIYGSDKVHWTDGRDHGIERFWRNIIGGSASVRFHRPPSGIGLDKDAQAQIRSARMLLDNFNIFEATPDANSSKFAHRSRNEAYLSQIKGHQYAIYFPDGGGVNLDLDAEGVFEVKWLNIDKSSWGKSYKTKGGQRIKIVTPGSGSWIALITKQ